MSHSKAHLLALGMLVAVTIIWGSGFIATEYAIQSQLHTAWLMAIRFLIGALVLLAAFFRRICAATPRTALRGSAVGVVLFAAFYTQTLGQGQTSVSNAAFITATNVVMIPLLLWGITRKRPPARVFGLCLMTMAGVILLTVDTSSGLKFGAGDWMVLLCAFLFALHIVLVGLLCREEDPIAIAFWQLLAAAVAGMLVLLVLHPGSTAEQWKAGLWPVLYLGLFSTGLCYLMQTWAQKYVPVSQAGVVLSLEGMFGALFSVLLGIEPFRINMLLGGLLITTSVILMERGERENAN